MIHDVSINVCPNIVSEDIQNKARGKAHLAAWNRGYNIVFKYV